jgi:hypothetical protein
VLSILGLVARLPFEVGRTFTTLPRQKRHQPHIVLSVEVPALIGNLRSAGYLLETGLITSDLTVRLVVISGFIDIYRRLLPSSDHGMFCK